MKNQYFNDASTLMVSTVALGEVYQQNGLGSFETMVFRIENGRTNYGQELFCERYDTSAEALSGHLSVIELVKAGEFDN